MASAIQTVAAFTFLSGVTPVTYSVANVGKKVFVIVSSVLVFGNHISPANAFGISVCVFGMVIYDKAKRNERAKAMMAKQSRQAAGDLGYLRGGAVPGLTASNGNGNGVAGSGIWPFSRKRSPTSDNVKVL